MSDFQQPRREWEQEWLFAEFHRLMERTREWAELAPSWPPFERSSALIEFIRPQLKELQISLGRVLVVGILGGSGTGKSTLINALVGERVCKAGKLRPTTRHPVVLCHVNVDPSFMQPTTIDSEVIQRSLPVLEQLILVDCPDPDTSDHEDDGSANQNLAILRQVLPRCDVLIYAGTAQKYKTHVVTRELLGHAVGRRVVFVQTHADQDDDIRDDWKLYLESIGFTVPMIYRLDGEGMLRQQERGEDVAGEFQDLREFLRGELSHHSRYRIKRANLLDQFGWLLLTIRRECGPGLDRVKILEEAIDEARGRLFSAVQVRLRGQLRANRQLWRTRLLRHLACSWGSGPFAGLIRLLEGGGSLLARSLVLARARTPIQILLTGGIAVGQTVGARWRERRAAEAWITGADLGIPGDVVIQERSVLTGYLRSAELGNLAGTPETLQGDRSGEEWVGVARRLYQEVEINLNETIELQVASRAGPVLHATMELIFLALPTYLLTQMGLNFFYERPIRGEPLLGLDFFLQAAFWVLIWGLLLRAILLHRLNRGLAVKTDSMAQSVSAEVVLDPLYSDMSLACRQVRSHMDFLASMENELTRLRIRLGGVDEVAIGRWDDHGTEGVGTSGNSSDPSPNSATTGPMSGDRSMRTSPGSVSARYVAR